MGISRRNQRLDLFRCIAVYSVIFLHVPFPGRIGVAINCLARFAVPLFFLSAGYFSWGKPAEVLLRRAKHCLGLLVLAVLAACVVSMLFGAFNGVLVAKFKIQPMVATLILYTAGRSIAAWINNNTLPVVNDPFFGYFGNFIPGIPVPTPIFIAVICMIIIALVMKFTTLGLYTQSVGINSHSARLNGLNPAFIKFLTYVILGLCVAVAGFIKVSRISTINYSVIAKDIEMDAILAVALGGNALSGGKFNMGASILGAYVIQFLTTTLFKFQVPSDALPAYKAVVVIILVVLSAPVVREKLSKLAKKAKGAK